MQCEDGLEVQGKEQKKRTKISIAVPKVSQEDALAKLTNIWTNIYLENFNLMYF